MVREVRTLLMAPPDNFGPRHPISIQSIEAGLDIILHAIMKYCNLSRLALVNLFQIQTPKILQRGEGYWMPEKFQNVLRVLRDSRATVKELQFETDQITDSMAELIRFSSAFGRTVCGSQLFCRMSSYCLYWPLRTDGLRPRTEFCRWEDTRVLPGRTHFLSH